MFYKQLLFGSPAEELLRRTRVGLTLVAFCLATIGRAPQAARGQEVASPSSSAAALDQTVHRSPVAVALSPDHLWGVTANRGAGSVSLISLFRCQVTSEILVGDDPADVAWVDQSTVIVTTAGTDQLVKIRIIDGNCSIAARLDIGDEPRGIAVCRGARPDGAAKAWIAVTHEDQLALVDLNDGGVIKRVSVGALPQFLAIAPNQKWLVTGCNGAGDVYVHDAETGEQMNRRAIFDDPANLGRPAIPADSTFAVFPHIVNRSFPVDEDNIEKGWVIDNRLTRLTLPVGEYWQQSQIGLDTRGDAVGDANAVAVSGDGRWLVVTCGGTHELLILEQSALRWPQSGPGDFIPSELLENDGRFRRLKLGGRPTDVEFVDERTAVVSNYLLNAVQIVDVVEARELARVALGGPAIADSVRRGEIAFYDADRSLNSWFSCHTCHTDGHTNGRTFDTLNDQNFDTYKLTPSLHGVTQTGPWTWNGWQNDLKTAIRKSMKDTMRTRLPVTDQDVADMHDYFATLQPDRGPRGQREGHLSAAARRGWATFAGKGGCAGCHAGSELTSAERFDVGTGSRRYVLQEFNPPSLRGLSTRRRFMHDGRARTLADVVTKHHRPENVAGEALSEAEVADLLAFLQQL